MTMLVTERPHSAPLMQAPQPAFDPQHVRKCLGQFATGVTVVSYAIDGNPCGATVNSFTSVSLDPPLILVSLARSARAATALAHCRFVVNVLSSDQLELAMHFAGRQSPDLIQPWMQGETTPRLKDCVAYFECEPWQTVEAGDHIVFLGRIVTYDASDKQALLFQGGQFRLPGDVLTNLKRILPLDGQILRWLHTRHQLADLAEEGVRRPDPNAQLGTHEEGWAQ